LKRVEHVGVDDKKRSSHLIVNNTTHMPTMEPSKMTKSFDWSTLHELSQQGVITKFTTVYCALPLGCDVEKTPPDAWQCTVTVCANGFILIETANGDTKAQARSEASYELIDRLRAEEGTLPCLAECKAWQKGRHHGGAPRWVVGDEYPHDEDRTREFKENRMDSKLWKELTAKNVSAFLNSEGGSLFFGINDDGIITGVAADRAKRDKVKLEFDCMMQAFQPSVDPRLYSFEMHLAHNPADPDKEMCVVQIRVHPGAQTDVYFTGGSSSQAFVRRDGSTHAMDATLIKECHTKRLREENGRLRRAIAGMMAIGNDVSD